MSNGCTREERIDSIVRVIEGRKHYEKYKIKIMYTIRSTNSNYPCPHRRSLHFSTHGNKTQIIRNSSNVVTLQLEMGQYFLSECFSEFRLKHPRLNYRRIWLEAVRFSASKVGNIKGHVIFKTLVLNVA